MSYIGILVTYIFVQNFILVQFLGLCPFIGVSKNSESAIGMGVAVTFVTAIASVVCWAVHEFLLAPFGLEYLRTIAFILVIASLVQLVEMVNIDNSYNLLESFLAGLAAGLGFTMAIILMSNIREKLEMTPVRKVFQGVPIAFISAGLMALAFMMFDKSLLTNLGLV